MDVFGFWQKWGMQLDDRAFANAFTALGVLAAPLQEHKSLAGKGLYERLQAALQISHDMRHIVPWRFPRREQSIKIGNGNVLLSDLKPPVVKDAWLKALEGSEIRPRFQVLDYPDTEQVAPWFRLFFEADPLWDKNAFSKAAHIFYNTAGAVPRMEWPLRLGYLGGNGGETIVQKACEQWESRELASAVKIDRENDNCDVLIFSGWTRQLLKTLLEMPGSQKTNLIVVRGRLDDSLASANQHLQALSSESSAKGFVFLDPDITDEVASQALNGFIRNLSHDGLLDVSISEAFARSFKTDPVIFLSRELADFQIQHFIEPMSAGFGMLPEMARIEEKPHVLAEMNIPVSTGDDMGAPKVVARKLAMHKDTVDFRNEYRGARGIKVMAKTLDDAEKQAAQEQKRFLQRQVYIKKEGELVEERRAFLKGVPTLIRLRIGPPDERWPGLAREFPEEKLPKDRKEWRLTVILTEPDHLEKALRKSIKLPRLGPSTVCEFIIKPGNHPAFEGRITVLHRGRVLQTGVLKGNVVADESDIPADSAISFTDILSVRSNIGDLDGRRQFDASFVLNQNADERHLLTAVATDHAWLADISSCESIIKDINYELTKVADLVDDYSGGQESEENVGVLVKLAQIGRQLYGKIVLGQIKQPGNQALFEKMEYIQIVSAKTEAILPLEFIYNAIAPNDDAKLCPKMEAVVKETDKGIRMSSANKLIEDICKKVDRGEATCEHRSTEFVCPMGFWGTSKVIERHMTTPLLAQPGKDFFLQSESTSERGELQITGTAIVAASDKVTPVMLSPVLTACNSRLGSPPQEATDWNDWVKLIAKYKPHLLVALPHTDGKGKNATLEIKGKTISSGQITEDHIHPATEKTYPIVALLGCDTTGTALEYGEYVSWFQWQGAALVISTIAKVFGGHAASVAEQLVVGLKQETDHQERLGEIIRNIKQRALFDGSLMALCVVAFGDADWRLN